MEEEKKRFRTLKHVLALPLSYLICVLFIAIIIIIIGLGKANELIYSTDYNKTIQNIFFLVIELILTLSLLFLVRFFLKFPIKKLFGRLYIKDFFIGFFTYYGLTLIPIMFMYIISPTSLTFTLSNYNTNDLFLNYVILLLMITVSAMTEELYFRAYLAYLVSDNISENVIIQMVYCFISGLLFSLLHIANPEVTGGNGIYALFFYFIFGFFLMLFYLKSKNIWFCFSVHLANNFIPAFIVSYDNSAINTFAIFTTGENSVTLITIAVLTVKMLILYFILCKFILKKRKL